MRLVDQWEAIEAGLPAGWEDVRLTLQTEQPGDLARAAQVLGPMGAGRSGSSLVLHVRRAGGAAGPEAARRLFARLDADRVWCVLSLDAVEKPEAPAAAAPVADALPLVEQWDAELATLPSDWSDLLGVLEVGSTDFLPRVALLCAPFNPTRDPDVVGFLFRCARTTGYGASPSMVRRCLERVDAEGISGRVSTRRVLADTVHVATQGPVWLVGGRTL
ncbi:MAG TPA: hypothetical protein VH572_07205 [Gaiella sp.]